MKGKNCIVTGGANGIGRSIAQNLVLQGANVIIADIDRQAGRKLAEKYSENIEFMYCDLGVKTELDIFCNKVKEKFSEVHVLVNNAYASKRGVLSECSYEDFSYVLSVGVTAPYYLTMNFKDIFANGSSIINISSTRAYMSQPDTESYTASKGAISALTHSLAVSLSPKVRVNSVSPGWIDTGAYQNNENYIPEYDEGDVKQHLSGRVGNPEDIWHTVEFLISDKSSFINGQNINVDGGMTKLMIYHNDHGWKYEK